jgi:putative ABC transport system substrate-binding protein
MNKKIFYFIAAFIILISAFITYKDKNNKLPVVAIANYGPHASLNAAINGFKQQMQTDGFIDGKTVSYEMADVGFDPSLIPQMLSSFKARSPSLLLVVTTPVAQIAKGKIHDVPLVFTAITDPVEAGLIKEKNKPGANITGSSEMQDLNAFLNFAKVLLPKAKKIGLLYATSESNDVALVKMMSANASKLGMSVVAIPIDQARDISSRMQKFKGNVDFIYVGTSGPIQPALPVIAVEARKMQIPVFNAESQAVRDGLAIASFGVDYSAVGKSAGIIAAKILRGEKVCNITPLYPTVADHYGVISKKLSAEFSIKIPSNVEIVE